MKNKLLKIFSLITFVSSVFVFSQTNPSLEMGKITGDGNPTGNGPALTQTINFLKNTNNPTGNTFATYTPALSATYTISNSRYTTSVNNSTVNMGYSGASSPLYGAMNSFGSPVDSDFTASGAITNGTGMSVSNNQSALLYTMTYPLRVNAKATNGTYPMADLTITFNRPVNNPIIHIAALGGTVGSLGFATILDLASSNLPLSSISLTRLSGNNTTGFQVSGLGIFDGSSTLSASGANSGSGSVRINGNGITSLTFTVSIRGDGGVASPNDWANSNTDTNSGDAITVGFSTLESDLQITKTVSPTNPVIGTNTVFTLTATNIGPANTNVSVNDLLPSGYTYVSSIPAAGTTYNSGTGIWSIGNLGDGASKTLTITAKVLATGVYTNTAIATGDNSDSNLTNNTALANPNPQSDSDGDGIGDLDDLDDDNDGILDVDELGICSPTSGVTSLSGFNGLLYDIPTTNSWALLSGSTSFPAASYTKIATFDYNEFAGTSKALSINYQRDGVSLSTYPKISNFVGSNIPNDGGEDYAIYFSKIITSVEAGKYQFDLDYGDDHVFLYKNNVKVYQLQNAYGSTTNNGLASITNVATLTLNPGDVLTYVVAEENVGNTAIKFLTTKLSQVDGSAARCIIDTDNDGIPNYLDVDSDGDGCPDAVEGSENVSIEQVWPLNLPSTDPNYAYRGQIKVIYNGLTTNTPANIISKSASAYGVPQLVNNAGNNLNTVTNPSNLAGVADNTDVPGPTTADVGQGVGDSANALVNACICYNAPNTGTAGVDTKHGITLLKRAGADNGNWPMIRKSAFTVLESNTKGFVITRLTTAQVNALVSPQEGMMVYDTTAKCLKLYNGTAWSCFNTPTCP